MEATAGSFKKQKSLGCSENRRKEKPSGADAQHLRQEWERRPVRSPRALEAMGGLWSLDFIPRGGEETRSDLHFDKITLAAA